MACTQYIQHTLICDNPPPPPWSKSSLTMPDLTFVLSAIIRHYPSLGDKVTCSCPKSSVLGVLGFSVVIRTYPSSKSLADAPHARGGEGTSTCHRMVKWCCAVVASSRPYPRHKEKIPSHQNIPSVLGKGPEPNSLVSHPTTRLSASS